MGLLGVRGRPCMRHPPLRAHRPSAREILRVEDGLYRVRHAVHSVVHRLATLRLQQPVGDALRRIPTRGGPGRGQPAVQSGRLSREGAKVARREEIPHERPHLLLTPSPYRRSRARGAQSPRVPWFPGRADEDRGTWPFDVSFHLLHLHPRVGRHRPTHDLQHHPLFFRRLDADVLQGCVWTRARQLRAPPNHAVRVRGGRANAYEWRGRAPDQKRLHSRAGAQVDGRMWVSYHRRVSPYDGL
mmetsp:Transcript_28285/g.52825  ORF Transcript_28285/g.52825 Transcript_28285/m.52825 type:complete len:243 (-) Transcript_28285:533-1261(-)